MGQHVCLLCTTYEAEAFVLLYDFTVLFIHCTFLRKADRAQLARGRQQIALRQMN